MKESGSIPTEINKKIEKVVLDVPFVRQPYENWCGYASLSMLLQYRGFRVTDDDLFLKANSTITDVGNLSKKQIEDLPGPTFTHMAAIASEIVKDGYKVGLFHSGKYMDKQTGRYKEEGVYQDYMRRNPEFTPDMLLDTFLKSKTPVMLRSIKHNVVVSGLSIDTQAKRYTVHDPYGFEPHEMSAESLHRLWRTDDGRQYLEQPSEQDEVIPIMSSSYLMLAIYPKRNK